MMSDTLCRTLGIDPSTRSVAFAVLEGSDRLIDWGIKTTGKADSKRALEVIQTLVRKFEPQVIAIEDCKSRGSRRCLRIRTLLQELGGIVPVEVGIVRIPISELGLFDPSSNVTTKYQRASRLAVLFPELHPRLPRFRKPWMSEDERTNIFDALSFAIASVRQEREIVDKHTRAA